VLIFAAEYKRYNIMPTKIPATKKGVRGWFLHLVIFIIGVTFFWVLCYYGKTEWTYPWPVWIDLAWSLALIGHACLIWGSFADKSYDEWRRQTQN
jgi:hypothetical protein